MKFAALIVLFLTLPIITQAEILNVPDDHETIQAGIDASEDGDTVLVQPGEYVENIRYLGKDIVVGSLLLTSGNEAYIDSTIIDGDQRGSVVEFSERVTSDAKLTGFTIQNGSGTSFGFGELMGGGIFILQSDVVIEHCRIRDNHVGDRFGEPFGGGIICYGWIDDTSPTIRDCEIYNNSSDGFGGGISIVAGCNPRIERVVIRDNSAASGGGISIIDECNVTMEYSVISDNIAGVFGGGIQVDLASSIDLQNVTIVGNFSERHGGGILSNGSGQINTLNSILWNDDPEEIYFTDGNEPNSASLSYSVVEGGEEGIVTNDNGDVDWGEGNIDEDPLFLDPDNGDFHLTADSPCIDAGDPDSPEDPDGTRADMGAFYYHQANEVKPGDSGQPRGFVLAGAYPNPFNASTSIRFSLPHSDVVSVSVYDLQGRLVQVLADDQFTAGTHTLVWDGGNLPDGIYIARLSASNQSQVVKLVLVR